jgi:Antibiotic biosynthesis monooxygenase
VVHSYLISRCIGDKRCRDAGRLRVFGLKDSPATLIGAGGAGRLSWRFGTTDPLVAETAHDCPAKPFRDLLQGAATGSRRSGSRVHPTGLTTLTARFLFGSRSKGWSSPTHRDAGCNWPYDPLIPAGHRPVQYVLSVIRGDAVYPQLARCNSPIRIDDQSINLLVSSPRRQCSRRSNPATPERGKLGAAIHDPRPRHHHGQAGHARSGPQGVPCQHAGGPRRTGLRCVEYGPAIDTAGSPAKFGDDAFVVIEKWESPEALKAHAASPHMAAYGAKTREMLASRVIHILSPA